MPPAPSLWLFSAFQPTSWPWPAGRACGLPLGGLQGGDSGLPTLQLQPAWTSSLARPPAVNCVRTPSPGPQDGTWGPRSSRHPSVHLASSSSPAMPGPGCPCSQNSQAITLPAPLGTPPALVGDRGGGSGVGSPCTYPATPTPGINSCWFCFYFNFFFGFDFFK